MLENLNKILEKREFISVATCDFSGRPNAAPKFFLKLEGKTIYLIDYTRGQTWQNLKINPRISLSFTDTESLIGYQVNGSVELIERGLLFEKICSDLLAREIDLSTKRIIEGVAREKKHRNFEVSLSDKFVIFKIDIEEVVRIGPNGEVKREKIEA